MDNNKPRSAFSIHPEGASYLRVERAQHLPPMEPPPPPPPQEWIGDELINLETGRVILRKSTSGETAEDYIL